MEGSLRDEATGEEVEKKGRGARGGGANDRLTHMHQQ